MKKNRKKKNCKHLKSLKDFNALAACGGFSFGDVLGAGEGWAKSILFNEKLRDEFQEFFERKDTVALGVCNGCQLMALLGWVKNVSLKQNKSRRKFELHCCKL